MGDGGSSSDNKVAQLSGSRSLEIKSVALVATLENILFEILLTQV